MQNALTARRHNTEGKTLLGFMMLLGSTANFIRCIKFTVPSPSSDTRYRFLPRPIPCSPVHVPPASRALLTNVKRKIAGKNRKRLMQVKNTCG